MEGVLFYHQADELALKAIEMCVEISEFQEMSNVIGGFEMSLPFEVHA